MAGEQQFDLRELSNQQYHAKSLGRYVMIGTALVVLSLSVLFWGPIFHAIGPGNDTSPGRLQVDYAVLAATPIVIAVTGWFLWDTRLGPQKIGVDGNGIRLQYSPRREIRLDWKDQSLWIDLYYLPSRIGPPTATDPRPLTFLKSSHTSTQPILLSRGAYEAVLKEAAVQKATIERLPVSAWNFGGLPSRTIRYRIRSAVEQSGTR